ncbi:MAG TPA: hypothetical protein VD978_14140 [Azospirillum sp.]|nr:hypothetical protein [Azospirillum sp.]
MRRSIIVLTAAMMLATPAPAADLPPQPATPGEQAKQGFELLLKALEGWIRQFPTYAPPEVTPEGDIIIRRLDRPRPAPPTSPPDPNQPPGGATNL